MAPYVPSFYDDCLVRISQSGQILWIKQFDKYSLSSVKVTEDGGFISAGTSGSSLWIHKTDSDGNTIWEKFIASSNADTRYEIQYSTNGGFIITGRKYAEGTKKYQFWFLKIDNIGNILWEKTFGGDEDDEAFSGQQTNDGGYIFTGYTKSFGNGGEDIWLIKTDENGDYN